MKKLFRTLLILAALWLVAGIAALIAIRLFLSPEKVARGIEALSAAYAGRAVSVGQLSYGWRGLRMQDVAISHAPNFDAGILIACNELAFGWTTRPLRPVISGRAGAVSFEAAVRPLPAVTGAAFENIRVSAGEGVLTATGTVRSVTDPSALRYTFSVSGDRPVLDRVLKLFPALASFQYGDIPTVSFDVEGSPDGLRVRRRPPVEKRP